LGSERSSPLRRAAPLALGVAAGLLAARRSASGVRPGAPYLAGAPLLIAHRGGSGLAPENTLTAFRQALEWWRADVLELDVRPTRDGEVVVFHDPTLERTTDGQGGVSIWSLAALRTLDAGCRFTPDGGASFPYRGRGVTIPTLAEVLEAFPDARVNVEIKDGRAQERVWEVVRDARAAHRVLIAAERRRNRTRFAGYPGAVSASAEDLWAFYLHHRLRSVALHVPRVDAFQMPERHGSRQVLGPRFVAEAHALNLAVHVWTVDDEADMRRLLDWGVDGVITDRPDRLVRVLHERTGRPLPAGPPAGEMPPSVERLLRP
jgi:glycerophosphoryl diester phosphodiesterase